MISAATLATWGTAFLTGVIVPLLTHFINSWAAKDAEHQARAKAVLAQDSVPDSTSADAASLRAGSF